MRTYIENNKKYIVAESGHYIVARSGDNPLFLTAVIAPVGFNENSYRDATEEEERVLVSAPALPKVTPTDEEVLVCINNIKDKLSNFSDEEALAVAALFPTWVSKMGEPLSVGDRVWYDGSLYKVRQAHTVQESWNPKVVPALFQNVNTEISDNSGTLESPYEWVNGLVAEEGKYYYSNGVTYRCIRNSGNPLYYSPAELVGNYFEEVQNTESDEPEVPQTGDGSRESPIPWSIGMVSENGKYYSSNGTVYLCTRDSGNPLYYDPSALIGLYFQTV